MSKNLIRKMHIKMKLYMHKLQDVSYVFNHLLSVKEIVADLHPMEVKYDDVDLSPSLFLLTATSLANFRDTTRKLGIRPYLVSTDCIF